VARGENAELLRLLVAVSLIVVACLLAADRAAAWLAPALPFSVEQRVAQTMKLDALAATMMGGGQPTPAQRVIEAALQARADRIARALQLPADMPITLHYVAGDTVNAFATLGGHVTVFRGLLARLRYEEELDAVLAHEIGHVQHRHVVQHLSRGVVATAALGLIGIRSASVSKWLIGDAQQLQQLAYSRDAEREADATAMRASQRLSGSTRGMVELFTLFDTLQRTQPGLAHLPWLQSHPLPRERARDAEASPGAARALTPLSGPLAVRRD
jgi:predicted Zn-dependent protease